MKVKDLIEQLQKINGESTISLLNYEDGRIEENISIKHNESLAEDELYCVNCRKSNETKKTDYYIV